MKNKINPFGEWIIREKKGKLYWSNEIGWVDKKSATRFTTEEKISLNLPVGGKWIKIKPIVMSTETAFEIIHRVAKKHVKTKTEKEALDTVEDFLMNNVFE